MKGSATYERRFKALRALLRKRYAPPTPRSPADPTEELIWSALLEDSTDGTAKVAMSRLEGHFVDWNEVRVSRPEELVEALPNTLPEPRPRAVRIIRALQAIFEKFDTLELAGLRDQPKREARNFVAALGEMTPFIEGRVCLLGLGIHAMPVDRTLVRLLAERGIVHPSTDPRDTQGFLERVVPAKDALETALLLEAFRQDPSRLPAPRRRPRRPRPAAPRPPAGKPPAAGKARPAKPAGKR